MALGALLWVTFSAQITDFRQFGHFLLSKCLNFFDILGCGQATSSLDKKFDADLDSILVSDKIATKIFLSTDEAAGQRAKIQIMPYDIESILVAMANCEVHFRLFWAIIIHVDYF